MTTYPVSKAAVFYGKFPGAAGAPFQTYDLFLAPVEPVRGTVLWCASSFSAPPALTELAESSFLGGFLARGYNVANVRRRPSDNPGGQEWGFPKPQDDVGRAVQHARTDDCLDPDRILLLGKSAGGVMAMGTTFAEDLLNPGSTDPVELESSRPTAVCAMSACTAFYDLPPGNVGAAEYFLKPSMGQVPPALQITASAAHWVGAATAEFPPTMLFSPKPDTETSKLDQSDPHSVYYQLLLQEALDATSTEHVFLWTPGEELTAGKVVRWLENGLGW